MTEVNDQFDSSVGGSEVLPQSINFQSFVYARCDEITALTKLIETPSSTMAMREKFPKKLRRRAMSHNVKRIPKRLRDFQIQLRERDGTSLVPLKRPRRKFRRKQKNLLDSYNRRQKEFVWLETHIWHAKRFRMIKKWGYSLPHFPYNKCYRACYRAISKYCLIQDISYYCCIELNGNFKDLIQGLNQHTSPECGFTFASVYTSSGAVESTVHFFKQNKFPNGAIGELRYLWKKQSLMLDRTLWLWCHPSFYEEVMEELIETFDLKLENKAVNEEECWEEGSSIKRRKVNEKASVEMKKLKLRNVELSKIPKFSSGFNSVNMLVLKDTLNRIRLIGPGSQSILCRVLQPLEFSKKTTKDWCSDYFVGHNLETYSIQYKFWNEIMKCTAEPAQLPSNMVLGLNIADPRFYLPKRGEHIKEDGIRREMLCPVFEDLPPQLPESPLWLSEIREEVSNKIISTEEINRMKSGKLVPGEDIIEDTTRFDFPILPILLINIPGNQSENVPLGLGSGWDIVAPLGYGLGIFMILNMHGARAGGLKETNSLLKECGLLGLSPDSAAGVAEAERIENELKNKYFRLPPGKRPNFIKLGVPAPFCCPWKILMMDWTGNENFSVLRSRHKLLSINNKLKKLNSQLTFTENDFIFLVPVRISMIRKGTVCTNATICFPTDKDLEKLKNDSRFTGPFEPPHEDNNENIRKQLRTEHKKLLKKLHRKRQKERRKLLEKSSSSVLVVDQKELMEELWVPKCLTVKDFSSRTVMGYVSDGDFSFTVAKSCGVGYVSLKALLKYFDLLEEWSHYRPHVLVRSPTTCKYWFAELNVIC